jgi:F0F1-type ATP synthase alpha subunit
MLKKAEGKRRKAFMEPIGRGFKPLSIGSHQIGKIWKMLQTIAPYRLPERRRLLCIKISIKAFALVLLPFLVKNV